MNIYVEEFNKYHTPKSPLKRGIECEYNFRVC